jgi:hypothetical protein
MTHQQNGNEVVEVDEEDRDSLDDLESLSSGSWYDEDEVAVDDDVDDENDPTSVWDPYCAATAPILVLWDPDAPGPQILF